jgi:pimeloyl-ACP methyl ester carboxylesterase
MDIKRTHYMNPWLPLWREQFAGLDWLCLRGSGEYRGRGLPKGDGEAVVLVPGFMASDVCFGELASWLKRMGYTPYLSNVGRNMDCADVVLERLLETVDKAHAETGARVTVIGHSLGGLLGRGVALARPGAVARVITLASPVNGVRVHPAVVLASELARIDCDGSCAAPMQRPLPAGVAEYNVFSKRDGIVDWRTCVSDGATPVEVRGTHVGMIVNRAVYAAIANALATDPASMRSRHRDRSPRVFPRHRVAAGRRALRAAYRSPVAFGAGTI